MPTDRHWDDIYTTGTAPWIGVPDWLKDAVERYQPVPKTILDLGSGTGDKSIWLARQGYRVTGIDISAVAIAEAEKNRDNPENPRFIHANLAGLAQLDVAPKSFGLIIDLVSSQFLSAKEQAGLLRTVRNLLAETGLFVQTRLEATGRQAPDWVKRIPPTPDLKDFSIEERGARASTNLPDVTIHKYILR